MTVATVRSAVSAFWLRVDDASTLVLVRAAYGLTVALWAVSLVPDFGLLFGSTGLNRTIGWGEWQRFTLFRYVDGEPWYALAIAVVIAGGVVIAAGRAVRVAVPLVAACQISLAEVIGPWGIGAENVLRVIGVYLAVFSLVTPSAYQGRLPGPGHSAGVAPVWGLQLIRIQIGLIYLVTALEKVRGEEWREGSAVYHALEIAHLRRFEAPWILTDWPVIVRAATWGTLAIEFLLAPLLFWPRTRRAAVVLAIALHLGFELFLELGFFAPAMTVGILAFVDPAVARRVLAWRPGAARGGAIAPS